MDSENTKQHDNHVQRGDGHEQDDENPKNGRDKRQEHSGAVEHDTKERHEQNEADDGSDHVRDRDRQRAVSRRDRAVVARPSGSLPKSIIQTKSDHVVANAMVTGERCEIPGTVRRRERAICAA
jgi:hypothetical protein